jgi:hypothetical protein
MNPKRILLILAGLLAFTVGLVTALHAQDQSLGFEARCSVYHPSQFGSGTY